MINFPEHGLFNVLGDISGSCSRRRKEKRTFSEKPKMLESLLTVKIQVKSRQHQEWGRRSQLKEYITSTREGRSVYVRGEYNFCLASREYINWTRLVVVFMLQVIKCTRQNLLSEQDIEGCFEV